MNEKELLDTANWYKSQRSSLWNFYLTVALAIVGASSLAPMTALPTGGPIFFVLIVGVFLVTNLGALVDSLLFERQALADLEKAQKGESGPPAVFTRATREPFSCEARKLLIGDLRSFPSVRVFILIHLAADAFLLLLLVSRFWPSSPVLPGPPA